MKHTPAPWIVEETIAPYLWRVKHKKHSLAVVKNQANAQLIVAAPDMLAVLQNLVERDLIKDPDSDHYEEAIQAINKATGEQA